MWLYLCEDASFFMQQTALPSIVGTKIRQSSEKMLKCCPERDYALRVSVLFGLICPDGDCFVKAVDAACLDDREIHFRPPVFRIVS